MNCALLSSHFLKFLTYNKCDFEHLLFFFTYFLCHFTQITPYYRPLFRVLRPILSVILRVFLDTFRYFSALIWSIFSIFWTYIKCDFYFFFLAKRRIARFLARIVHYYKDLFWLFGHKISVILSMFNFLWQFLDSITLKSHLIIGHLFEIYGR